MFPSKDTESKEEKFDWHEEGISSLVRLIVLAWTGAILTLNYVSIPGIPQQKIDPTFIASVFTGTLATFGVTPSKNGNHNNNNDNNKTPKIAASKKEEKIEKDQ
tara:strand:+ start:668 stop:979 length:312 start_codon:yes stop_codon:yes gene_type:complete